MKPKDVGYKALIEKFHLDTMPHWHYSSISNDYTHKVVENSEHIYEIYPKKYAIEDSVIEHLEFALKYDGINLTLLTQIFEQIDTIELTQAIQAKPTGKYIRKIWYFYEFLMGEQLAIDDLKQGNYVDLLEKDKYYSIKNPSSIKRQRIRDNLLGNRDFCPIVRKTKLLQEYEALDLSKKVKEVLTQYPTDILKRALSYLYTKETKSSFEIERIKASSSRVEKFVSLLKEAHRDDFCTKEKLIALQNRIVDNRFKDDDYRVKQNYVGESISYEEQRVHFISPKPIDLENLMNGLIQTNQKLSDSKDLSVIQATIISYGFVFLHPFEDGNGRIHRFLLHNILARSGFTQKEMIFPISAVMLKNPHIYDDSLEDFSKPLLSFIDYDLNEEGEMNVLNDTALFYRSIEMTKQVETIYAFILKTIEEELVEKLKFISFYDSATKAIQKIVDMPNRQIDLFIRFTLQNAGKLSENKRKKYFDFLTHEEIFAMEEVLAWE